MADTIFGLIVFVVLLVLVVVDVWQSPGGRNLRARLKGMVKS